MSWFGETLVMKRRIDLIPAAWSRRAMIHACNVMVRMIVMKTLILNLEAKN